MGAIDRTKNLAAQLWPWLCFALVFGTAFWALNRFVPAQHLPWKSLDPDRPIGHSTATQLMRLALSPSDSCMGLASDVPTLSSVPADPKEASAPCGWTVARTVTAQGNITLAGEANMQCPLSVGVSIWLRDVDRAAQDRFDATLTKVHHFGTYSCRRQRGNSSGAWSEHAFANAWDIASFELSDGQIISLKNDWTAGGERAAFLRDARDSACRVFRVTLSPDYNAAHHDHFHIDMGPSRSCR